MGERAFAYILYLTPDWRKEYGGSLQLYESDSTGTNISTLAKSIVPYENSFVFFRVQHNSWHSVEEVLTNDSERISINGWFHCPDLKKCDLSPRTMNDSRCISYTDFDVILKLYKIIIKYF